MRIKDIATTAGSANGDDYVPIDGATAGARKLLVSNLPGGGGGGGGNYFGKVAVSGQSDVVADADPDTLTLVNGAGITITTNATTDSVTISVSDPELIALAGLTSAADKGMYFTGSGMAATFDLTAYVRALCALSTAADVRSAMSLGDMAIQASSSVGITGGSIVGITDLAIADGGTGASSASAARTNLGLAIGADVQAYDADLAAVAGLSTTGFVQRTGAGSASAGFDMSGCLSGDSVKSGPYTLQAGDGSKTFVFTASATLTVPAVGTLAAATSTAFHATIINDTAADTVTIDGPGGTNVALAAGEVASVIEYHNGTAYKQRVVKGASTVVS